MTGRDGAHTCSGPCGRTTPRACSMRALKPPDGAASPSGPPPSAPPPLSVSIVVAAGQGAMTAASWQAISWSASDIPSFRVYMRRCASSGDAVQRSCTSWALTAAARAAAAVRCSAESRTRPRSRTRRGPAAPRLGAGAPHSCARSSRLCRSPCRKEQQKRAAAAAPASSLRIRSLLSTVQPSRSAIAPARADLPVPGSPPISTRVTAPARRCRSVISASWRASPAAAGSPCPAWIQATFARTKAR